jgi:ElaB/YqjD/DUF883 family membrane-anchored ribosome-binding protein
MANGSQNPSYPGAHPNQDGASADVRKAAAGAMDSVKQGAQDAVDRVSDTARQLADQAAPAMDRVKSSIDSASDAVRSRAEDVSAMSEDWMKCMRETVREHPIATIALAIVAGLVINRMRGD